jgi:ABC-type transport system involved in multi-copper enzyme maturation permease subunit
METKPNTIYRALDRKAAAITEFTMRQYRTKASTWVVLGVGLVAISLVLLIYIDVMSTGFESVDNDGDSYDPDNDGYPTGQEMKFGTDPFSDTSHPGLLVPSIAPEPASNYIDEDGFDIVIDGNTSPQSTGYDDDGDCRESDETASRKDSNGNGLVCDVLLEKDRYSDEWFLEPDRFVDEDPDDAAYAAEASHMAFVLGIGKMGFVLLLGMFLPLFLATGLIREEMTAGTMHFMLAKPIARTEVFLYRILGYLGIVWPYFIITGMVFALISGFVGPSEGFFRFQDLGIWLAIVFATMMASFVYGMLFCALGTMWRFGIVLAIPFAAWELGMCLLSMGAPDAAILRFSVIGWAMMIIDAAAIMAWPNVELFILQGTLMDDFGLIRQTGLALDFFYSKPGLGMSGLASAVLATVVLLIQGAVLWFIGGAIFKGKEIE